MLDGTATEIKSTKRPRGTVRGQSIGGSMLNRHCMIALMTPHHNNIDADQSMNHDAETVSKHTTFHGCAKQSSDTDHTHTHLFHEKPSLQNIKIEGKVDCLFQL
jgi:hypothetical protein